MSLALLINVERWPLREPFAIAREVTRDVFVLTLTLNDANWRSGRGEAAGVDYAGDTLERMVDQLRDVAHLLDADLPSEALAALLPPGGARNAIDCALWDLRAKTSGVPAWRAAGLAKPRTMITAVTIGLGDAEQTRRRAHALRAAPLIKVKVARRPLDAVRIVRKEAPAARIVVDANEAWTPALLERSLPGLLEAGVELIEQPLPRGEDRALAGLASPIPIAADESCTDRRSLDALQGLYQAINIKLDKAGGLSEGLALAREARARGFEIMVGNMCGSSLAMAPAFLVAQLARWADLDGPLLQQGDRPHAMRYAEGRVHPPKPALWG